MTSKQLKITASLAGLLILLLALYAWRQSYLASHFEKQSNELTRAREVAEQKASEAEGKAKANQLQAQQTEAQIAEATIKAEAADRALNAARNITVSLKGAYDQTRNKPVDPSVPVSIADACAKLAALGYPCQ